jgi:dipeptidyl aminopeptidase/acylaminoacyl peptidase
LIVVLQRACIVAICLFALGADIGAGRSAQSAAGGQAIRKVQPVTPPAFDAHPRIALFAPGRAEYERAARDPAFVMERLTYRSDGLDVFAYLYRPTAPPPTGTTLPVVVFNRGSYVRDDFSYELLLLANRMARQGYLIVAPMLRGSGGAGGQDEMGGADLHDLFNILPVVAEIPFADARRVFLYGESRGGIMSLLAARDGFPARAIAVWGAITDMRSYMEANPAVRKLGQTIWPDYEKNESAILKSRSAIEWPERINVPVLIMNGGADTDVPPLHALQLASALNRLSKPFELKIFHGERHIPTARAAERDEEVMRWFRRFDLVN